MTHSAENYAYLSRNYETIDDRPRFIGFTAADQRTSDLMTSKEHISDLDPLRFIVDEQDLRRSKNCPGEIGHFNLSGNRILISAEVREVIHELELDGVDMYPSILEGIEGTYTKPLYYINIWKRRDIWSRECSEFLLPFDPDHDRSASLLRIALNKKGLAKLHPQERTIIKLDRVNPNAILFENSLVRILNSKNLGTGARFYPLTLWFDGIDFA